MQAIALINDDSIPSEVDVLALRNAGYAVTELRSSQQAVQGICDMEADLFIIDLPLSYANGFTLSRLIRRIDGEVGIILRNADSNERGISDGLRTGADLYFIKPLDTRTLLAAIHSLSKRLA